MSIIFCTFADKSAKPPQGVRVPLFGRGFLTDKYNYFLCITAKYLRVFV